MNKKIDRYLLLSWIFVIGGIFGFIYETIFYKIDLGIWVKRGSSFGPWIPIYGIGALLILLTTYKIKKNPIKVFLISSIVCGELEYLTGLILDKIFNIRLWDYNQEILNFGNINGYICFRSVFFFGLSSIFLIYIILPLVNKCIVKIKNNNIKYLTLIPSILFLFDIVLYRINH